MSQGREVLQGAGDRSEPVAQGPLSSSSSINACQAASSRMEGSRASTCPQAGQVVDAAGSCDEIGRAHV